MVIYYDKFRGGYYKEEDFFFTTITNHNVIN